MKRRKWRFLLCALALPAGVVCYVLYQNRPDGFSIGPTPVHVEYRPASLYGRKPWVDFDLFGNHFEYPANTTLEPFMEGVAGSLSVVGTSELKWRVAGVEYRADIYGTEDYAGGGFASLLAVPYALSPDQTHVELYVKDRWIPVSLPYKPGQVPPNFSSESSGNDEFSIELTPIRRLSTASGRLYSVHIKGGANLVTYQRDEGVPRGPAPWRAGSAELAWQDISVWLGNTVHWRGRIGFATGVPLNLRVFRDSVSMKATLPNAVIYDTKRGLTGRNAGFDALEIPGAVPGSKSRFVADQPDPFPNLGVGSHNFRVIGYKFVRSTSFDFNLKNDETIQK